MTGLYEPEPEEAPGDRWWLVVAVAAGVSLVSAVCFPPAGVILFMGTTVLALRRFRQMPVTVIVVATAALLAALATPASFLSPSATGTSSPRGAELAPSPRPGVPSATVGNRKPLLEYVQQSGDFARADVVLLHALCVKRSLINLITRSPGA